MPINEYGEYVDEPTTGGMSNDRAEQDPIAEVVKELDPAIAETVKLEDIHPEGSEYSDNGPTEKDVDTTGVQVSPGVYSDGKGGFMDMDGNPIKQDGTPEENAETGGGVISRVIDFTKGAIAKDPWKAAAVIGGAAKALSDKQDKQADRDFKSSEAQKERDYQDAKLAEARRLMNASIAGYGKQGVVQGAFNRAGPTGQFDQRVYDSNGKFIPKG